MSESIQSPPSTPRASPNPLPLTPPATHAPQHLPDKHLPPPSPYPAANPPGYHYLHLYPTPSPQPLQPPSSFVHPLNSLSSHGFSHSHTFASQPQPPQGPTPVHFHSRLTPDRQTYQGPGMFKDASYFSVTNSTFIDNMSDIFMEKLLQHTIIGAEFDSVDRHPPPRCHPGTRVAILKRCFEFIAKYDDEGKLRWVVGPAGAGKSAVLQYVAENSTGIPFASVFLSNDRRHDGNKIIVTIAYQLAVKCLPYRQFIQNEINLDPALLRKSLSTQFNKFIIEPLIVHHVLDHCLILVDGLDECDNIITQRELLGLISNLCTTYPTSPIKWLIASRPEPHISLFFDRAEGTLPFSKEELLIDSAEACEDVQLYLRDELKNVQLASPTLQHKRHWPLKHQFSRIATAAGGLFAYASTVMKYIGNPNRGNPVTLLTDVLLVIEGTKLRMLPGKDHPMDHLDALYARIISRIRDGGEEDTRKLLLLCLEENRGTNQFRLQCNLLGLTEDDAYGAVHHTYSVMKVPKPDHADEEYLGYFHDSFKGYISDFERSKFIRDVPNEADELSTRSSLRVVEEVVTGPDKETSQGGITCEDVGYLKGGPDVCANISLSWPSDERFQVTDDELKLILYRSAVADVSFRFEPGRKAFADLSCFRVLTTRFTALGSSFRRCELRNFAFDDFRHELTKLGILKQVPLRTLDSGAICADVDLRFTNTVGTDMISDPWDASCKHKKRIISDLKERQGWITTFGVSTKKVTPNQEAGDNKEDTPLADSITSNSHERRPLQGWGEQDCHHCSQRLSSHLVDRPDQLVTMFVDSTDMCYVELSIEEPVDGGLNWRYRFCHSGPPKYIDS